MTFASLQAGRHHLTRRLRVRELAVVVRSLSEPFKSKQSFAKLGRVVVVLDINVKDASSDVLLAIRSVQS